MRIKIYSDMDDDDDPVVHEVDVYLSKSLADNLYVFQYPVRPSSATYEDVSHLSARIKPKQKKVEIELGINTTSEHYASSKGEQIALNVDGAFGAPGAPHFTSDKMDKQVLVSTTAVTENAQYAVGLLKDDELHLTPVHGVIQLRPSFGYLDKVDTKLKEQLAAEAGENSQEEAEVEDAKPVLVKFARAESAEAKARRLASFGHLQKTLENERWVDVRYHPDPVDSVCDRERLQLMCTRSSEETRFMATPDEYLQMLLPEATKQNEEKPAMPNNVLSLTQLKTMGLSDQIKALLISAKALQFSQLLSFLPKGIDQTAALRSLQQVAMLVQGCWVVKSEVLHPKDTFSSHSGVAAEVLCRGRDYVMWKFTQDRFVVRKDVAAVIKLAPEDVKAILEQMARIRMNKGWEFRLDFDRVFIERFPDVVERQEKLWELKHQQLIRNFRGSKDEDTQPAQSEKPKRRRTTSTRSRTKSGDRSLSDLSDTDNEKPNKKTDKKERKRSHSGSGRGDGLENVPNNVFEPPSTHSISNGSVEASKTASVELKTELIKFVREKLFSRYVMTLTELKKLFSLHLLQCPPGHILGTGVSNKLLEQSVIGAGGERINNQWPPNAQEESMFALVKTGDKTEEQRKILMSMFTNSFRIKSGNYKRRVEEELGISLSDNDMRKILKEYCFVKGCLWYLKGTCVDS